MTLQPTHGPDAVAAAIEAILATSNVNDEVARYFDPDTGFAADTFNTVGDNDPFDLTESDLLAVSLLDTPLPPNAVRGLLGPDRGTFAHALHEIGPDLDLWDPHSDQPRVAAATLWSWLHRYRGVGDTRAGKLLARKRPRLIPIIDSVVAAAIPARHMRYWDDLATALRQNPHLVDHIEALRPASLTRIVSTLRLLDVAVWMTQGGSGTGETSGAVEL